MKKIITFLIVFIFQLFSIVQAQNLPEIVRLENGLFFPNLTLREERTINLSTNGNCSMSNKSFKRFYSYTATASTNFAFQLESTNKNFNFHVWKLPVGQAAESIFTRDNSTILPNRMLYATANIKGLSLDNTMLCEYYSGRNFVNSFYTNAVTDDQLKTGETIVIVITGDNDYDKFNLTLETIPQHTKNYSGNCLGDQYKASIVKQDIRNETGYADVKLYYGFGSAEYTDEFIDNPVQLIGLVRNNEGEIVHIYTLNFSYEESYIFYNTQNNIQLCGNQYTINFEEIIRTQVSNYGNINDFEIDYVEYLGRRYNDGDVVTLSFHYEHFVARIRYVGTATCTNFTDMLYSVRDNKAEIFRSPIIEVCGETFTIDMDDLRLQTQVIANEYELKLYLPNGTEVRDGDVINLPNGDLILTTKAVHRETNCYSESDTITIKRTTQLPIVDASINSCLSDLNQTIIDQKIVEIKNGANAIIKFYFNGNQIQENQILNIIRTNLRGQIEAKVDDGCPVTKLLRFNLQESSVTINQEVYNYKEICQEIETVISYDKSKLIEIASQNIQNYISANNYTFTFFDENNQEITSVLNLQTARNIKVEVRLNTESCSILFNINLSRQNKLVINNPTRELTASCDNTITFTNALLIDLFGNDVTTHQTSIELNRVYPLTFNTSNQAVFAISFYEDVNCQVTKEIIINKGEALNVDLSSIQNQIDNNPFRFCGSINRTELQAYIQNYVTIIQTQFPSLQLEENMINYVNRMIDNSGEVSVKFISSEVCGSVDIKFSYLPYPMPTINLDSLVYICSNTSYSLDLSTLDNPKVKDQQGNEISSIGGVYELGIGLYRIIVTNEFGCSIEQSLEVRNSSLPIINEIIISTNSIQVLATGNGGVLEYSVDGLNWQTSNLFNQIEKGKVYTVFVRENNCAVTRVDDVVYLNLPNFISPNGDGINDVWKPIGATTSLAMKVYIFDRYGKMVYSAEGINALNWNGKYNGRPLVSDSYWYFAEYVDQKAMIKLKYQGYITIKSQF